MNTHILTRVRRHFNSDLVPASVNRANQRKWVRSIRRLGAQWLLHPASSTTAPWSGSITRKTCDLRA